MERLECEILRVGHAEGRSNGCTDDFGVRQDGDRNYICRRGVNIEGGWRWQESLPFFRSFGLEVLIWAQGKNARNGVPLLPSALYVTEKPQLVFASDGDELPEIVIPGFVATSVSSRVASNLIYTPPVWPNSDKMNICISGLSIPRADLDVRERLVDLGNVDLEVGYQCGPQSTERWTDSTEYMAWAILEPILSVTEAVTQGIFSDEYHIFWVLRVGTASLSARRITEILIGFSTGPG
ncbi:hypothetical protein DFP72DRAFT_856665 [Ephemerocybe angulata]|uniref:Uncharacterized protein n=1 Tax=Ephemerocybe angulata TaxID=980116 RepID=A0A8H6LWH5_9AGAR|nr:hypothetical protein DFP72DRAFT_856665 [Tulosesus angulatus]